ncbi:hypothetical protein G5B39_08420 [Rhodobacteraceae bacterium SC52]|nr:hypothetical protein G5B39_08420 [Rhodobacteraceae bacterium SC52]
MRCNQKQSSDEAYFYCILSAVLSGSPKPQDQILLKAKRILQNDKSLRKKISQSINDNVGGLEWKIEVEKISRTLENYARGHLFLSNSETYIDPAHKVEFIPKSLLDGSKIEEFFVIPENLNFPEVGSRSLLEMYDSQYIAPEPVDEFGFSIVSAGEYRYRTLTTKEDTIVQSVFHEYLLTTVSWIH